MCRDADGAGTDGGAGTLSLRGSMGPADLGDRMSIIAWLVLGLFTAFGGMGVTGFNLYSMVVAIIGAIIVLWIYHAIAGRSRTVL